MKVLFVTSEAAPIKKFGGLGDVSGALPKALEKEGVDVDIIIPFYSDAKVEKLKVTKHLDVIVQFDNESHNVTFYKTKLPNSDVDVIMPKYEIKFSGDFLSDSEYFAFFDKCVVEYIKAQYNTYDVVHTNDWHTGFITHLLEDEIGETRPKTLLTIHNIGYQGVSSPNLVREVGLMPGSHPLIDWDISDGDVNMLLQAITSSDYVNTVSPSYAEELKTKEFGGDFAELINNREGRFTGILNGIDYSELPREFDENNWQQHKGNFKDSLRDKLNMSKDDKPLVGFISRLDAGQKGLDVLYGVIPHIVKNGGQFILLGTGDKLWEGKLRDLNDDEELKGNVSINIEFDVKLALEIYKGSDFFLIPSKYEPCGLTQMMSMWYGTLPIAHNVGGLKDTIKDGVNGFTFGRFSVKDFEACIDRAFEIYHQKDRHNNMVVTAMKEDFSWEKSAKLYKSLYHKLHG